jgi:hypothetical protein
MENHTARVWWVVTHDELVLKAVRWLKYVQKCKPIFAEMVTCAQTTPDAIGWNWGESRLIEVKVSRSDFFRDRKKIAHRAPDMAMGRRRWYMTPTGLVRPEEVPEGWGLVTVDGANATVIVEAPERVLGSLAQTQEMRMLSSAIRRLTLGSNFKEATGRWETLVARLERQEKPIV